jgi:UDP-N-acetyl-D-glucosamine dehydrogenase
MQQTPESPQARFMERIERRELVVGVIGLGYVGLPLALAFTRNGSKVIGFDIDAAKVNALNAGRNYIKHIDPERVTRAVRERRLEATNDFDRLAEPDALLIAVPTPLTRQREPDLSFIVETARQIAGRLRPGQLIVLESTTYPGTTDEVVLPILEQSGLKHGRDFFLAFSPEREDPGNPDYDTRKIPKVVGGVDAMARTVAQSVYGLAIDKVVAVSTARAAEAVKLTENIFRAVNIALVNELKIVYTRMGIDVWDVLEAASTKPFGFMRFNPGPGLGGHCIPIDPFYLTWKAREYGLTTRFIELAGEINVNMPRYVVERLQSALNDRGRPLRGSRVLILGVAYKKDIDDPRESPSFEIMHLLAQNGALLDYHDTQIPVLGEFRSWPELPRLESVQLSPPAVAEYAAVLIATDHSGVDYDMIAEHAQVIIDTRGVYRQPRSNVVKA